MRHERRFRIPDDLRALQRAIYDLSPISLVVLDPIMGYCGKWDGTGVAGMHALLEPLAWMAARTHVAIVATIHLRRGSSSSVFRAAGNPAFQIEGEGKLVWNGAPVLAEINAKKSRKRGRKKGSGEKLLAAAAWLRAFLAAGPRRASEAVALGERAGFSEPTLERAKREIGATATHHGGKGRGGFWIWTAAERCGAVRAQEK